MFRFQLRLALAALFVFSLALTFPSPLSAQVAGATLSGVVKDPSGAAIPDAAISIVNLSNGDVRDLVTNREGFYSAPNLLPGAYSVTATAQGFKRAVQKDIALTIGAQQSLSLTLEVGAISQSVEVQGTPPDIQTQSSTLSATVDSRTVRELPLNGRDWTSLATLEPGVLSIPNQATASFSANKGNRGFGNQLTNSGHRPNENNYRVNGISTNDYSNAAPGGSTGVNLGVDAIQEFSVLTNGYTAEYGRTSGAVINAIMKSGSNQFHGSGYGFFRNSALDAKNFFDPANKDIPPFSRKQFGASAGGPIIKNKLFVFGDYEGIRQDSSSAGTIRVPDAVSRAAAVPAIAPYLALWPIAPAGSPDANGIQTFSVVVPNSASENYVTTRVDQALKSGHLAFSYFFDSGPQSQADPLGNTVHQVFSQRQMGSVEYTHIFGPGFANTVRAGVSRIIGDINAPQSGNAVATNKALAIAPGALAPPQIPVSGLTTAYGLGGFNQFNHGWNSGQVYDDAFLTRGTHSIKIGFAFERMQYNVLERLSPNGRMNTYTLAKFLSNAPDKLNALAPGGSHEIGFRESLFAGYIQDDWRVKPNLTFNFGLRYEATTRPTNSTTVPGYTVNGYTVATANFQQIISLSNCTASPTACGPVGTDSPILRNPTTKNFEPRFGFAWDPFSNGKTAIRGGFAIFDVLPLPYQFGLNTSATAPFQIIGADTGATLGTGVADPNLSFNPQAIRNRFIDAYPKRAYVMNWNVTIQRDLAGFTLFAGYVGSRSLHLSAAADDINLVQPALVNGVGYVFPCNPSLLSGSNTCANQQTGTRIDPNWGGGAGIRPVLYDATSTYHAFQSQIKKQFQRGIQGQISYTYGTCNDNSSAPVTGDTYLNSIAVPLLLVGPARSGPCDFDIRQAATGTLIWQIPGLKSSSRFLSQATKGWEIGSIVTRTTGAPFTVTVGNGNDPLGTGYNGDFTTAFASLVPGCNPIQGGVNYLNKSCFTPPSANLAPATAANPYGCAPNSFPKFAGAPGTYCSNVLGNLGRNRLSGPGLMTWDLSIFKNIQVPRISESFKVQLRAEFFNVLNHANFLSPGFINTFGQNNSVLSFDGGPLPTALNQTSTASRQIQLGIKVNW